MTERAYYVERVARTVTTFLVYAETALEARERAEQGGGEPIASETYGGTWRKPVPAPGEDR